MKRRNASEIRRRAETAVRDHSPALLAYFARRVSVHQESADLLAETLLVFWRRASSMPTDDSQVRPWMFGIARNVLMHHHRGQARRRALSDRLRELLETIPRAGFSPSAEFDELHQALERLDPVDQEIVRLLHWDGFTLNEISGILEMNPNTVRSRYHRTRKTLKSQLSTAAEVQAKLF